jgi:hypothetical protein
VSSQLGIVPVEECRSSQLLAKELLPQSELPYLLEILKGLTHELQSMCFELF